jgi:hypothetical protein
MSTSVAYLRKRLTDIGRQDLLDAVNAGAISTFAAAEEAGLIRRQEVLGTGSPNQAKKRAWTLARITRQAPPLATTRLEPEFSPARPKFSQGTRNGQSVPTTPIDLEAILAEWELAQKPAVEETLERPRRTVASSAAIPPEPFPAHPATPCTRCDHPQHAAALREILNTYVAARRGEPHQTGNTLPRACCQWFRRPDIRALIA